MNVETRNPKAYSAITQITNEGARATCPPAAAAAATTAEMPVTNTDGYDANGRPDELLKRITYDTSIWQHAFLFADGEATAGRGCSAVRL